jgi:peptidoglycan/LPS O-acetylase OafA/YrhL
LKYRSEIDGLRALAVVPVILFHAGFDLFSGGFVGVDVFFVISGYLITTILIEDIENDRFSLVNFLERRARRILPALFFIMLVCIPFAWIWMLPSQMKDFLQSLVAASLFASNILFWKKENYFEAAAQTNPLLHTWTLAVEAQYYILFPIFLILAWRFGKNRVFWMIVMMAVISLLLSEWGWRNKPTANFYLAPTRAWELFAGSIVAFVIQKNGVQKNNFLAILGLAAIIFSIFAYDKSTPFPSVYTLAPVLGVVLLILYAEKETIVAKLLNTKSFVGLGLISYSTYLWHQPLFVFAKLKLFSTSFQLTMIALSFLSVMLGYLSWRYVEKPFRTKEIQNRVSIFGIAFIGLTIFLIFFFGEREGYENRLSAKSIDFNQRLYNKETQFEFDVSAKRAFVDDGRKKILIIGDSYAKDFLEGLVTVFGDDINRFDIVMKSVARRCKNVLADTPDLNKYLYPSDTHCFDKIERIGSPEWLPLIKDADLIIVRSYWDVLPTFEMPRTYDYLNIINNQRVIFIGSQFFGTNNLFNNPFNSLVKIESVVPNMETHGILDVKPYSMYNYNGYTSYDLIVQAAKLMSGRNYFDVMGLFCSKKKCRVTDENGYPLTNDLSHLTSDGERMMMNFLFNNVRFREIWGSAIVLFPQ